MEAASKPGEVLAPSGGGRLCQTLPTPLSISSVGFSVHDPSTPGLTSLPLFSCFVLFLCCVLFEQSCILQHDRRPKAASQLSTCSLATLTAYSPVNGKNKWKAVTRVPTLAK